MTPAELAAAFEVLQPGRAICYHVGHVFSDRKSPAVAELASAALALSTGGSAELVQRRVGVDKFEYLAIKRHTPAPVGDGHRPSHRVHAGRVRANGRKGEKP